MTETKIQRDYYGPLAYRSDQIPTVTRKVNDLARPWFNRKFDMRLPWGGAENVVPGVLRERYTPEELRKSEANPKPFGDVKSHQQINQEQYRHATAALRTRILVLLSFFGHKYILAFISFPILVSVVVACVHKPSNVALSAYSLEVLSAISWIYTPFLTCWAIPTLLLKYFPKFWIKPSKGPKWELNRRTGLVTQFIYDKKGHWGQTGKPEERVAPFYEFDAYLTNEMIPPGQVVHTLYLAHRHEDILLPIGSLIGKTSGPECFALWDMFQNFMDTSRPLPDIPLWEEFRPLDPVTAEHDRATNRPPRYWRDMDDDTWKQKNEEFGYKVLKLNTISRPNQMRRKVKYERRKRKTA